MTSILNALYERITQPSSTDQSDIHSNPFVKIVGGKLQLVGLDIPETDIRVMSILGKARMGKSTFLNSIVTKIEGKSVQPFQTQDNDEHCTRGIDYYYCPEKKLVLMDCQGLALEDSSHDPALLLFTYLISDIIIFNERMMLQNEALKLLEPICTFMTYLDFDGLQKPKLYFRISDGDIVKDVQKNLQKIVHTQYNDQYQSIRDSIMNLFQTEIGIVKTDTLDKSTKAKLQGGDYSALLQEGLGFADAVQELLDALPSGRSSKQWKHDVPRFIEQINMNEKITIDKLDIVGQTGKLEILEWVNALATISEPEVDGTQASYEKNVEPIKTLKKNLLTQFTRKFKAISDTIKEAHRQKLAERLTVPIVAATAKSVEKAEQRVKRFVEDAQKDRAFPEIHTLSVSMTGTDAAFFDDYLSTFRMLKRACDDVYEPVKTKYLTWLDTQEEVLMKAVDQCRVSEVEDIENMNCLCNTNLEEFQVSRLQEISNMTTYILGGIHKQIIFGKPEEITQCMYNEAVKEFMNSLKDIFRPYTIQPILTNKVMKVVVQENEGEVPANNDILKPMYDSFCAGLKNITTNSVMLQAITVRKIEILRNKELNASMVAQIADVPMVVFCREQVSLPSTRDIYVTADTFDSSYHELYKKVLETMVQKGFLAENSDLMKTTQVFPNICRKHCVSEEPHLLHLFNHTYNKVVAREILKGFVIPTIYSS